MNNLAGKLLLAGAVLFTPFIEGCGGLRQKERELASITREDSNYTKEELIAKSRALYVLFKQSDYYFSANSYLGDKNGNNKIDNDETIGIDKRRFNLDEEITLGYQPLHRNGEQGTFYIEKANGERITPITGWTARKKKEVVSFSYQAGQIPEGSYFAIWNVEGKEYPKSRIPFMVSSKKPLAKEEVDKLLNQPRVNTKKEAPRAVAPEELRRIENDK